MKKKGGGKKQLREALIPAMALASYTGGRNVQLFSARLYVGLGYPTMGCSPLPTRVEQHRVSSSGWLCHLEQGHQPHMPHAQPWPWVRYLSLGAAGAPDSLALQEKG